MSPHESFLKHIIWPNWSSGRAVHVHMMIRQFSAAGAQTYRWQTQLFFDPATTLLVIARAPDNTRGTTPGTLNSADRLYTSSGGSTLVTTSGSVSPGFAGAITLGVHGTT